MLLSSRKLMQASSLLSLELAICQYGGDIFCRYLGHRGNLRIVIWTDLARECLTSTGECADS